MKTSCKLFMLAALGPVVGWYWEDSFDDPNDKISLLGTAIFLSWSVFWVIAGGFAVAKEDDEKPSVLKKTSNILPQLPPHPTPPLPKKNK